MLASVVIARKNKVGLDVPKTITILWDDLNKRWPGTVREIMGYIEFDSVSRVIEVVDEPMGVLYEQIYG